MSEQLSICVKSESAVNYALFRSGIPVVDNVRITNLKNDPAVGLRLVVRAENDEIGEYSCMLPDIPAYASAEVSCKDVHPSVKVLSAASERYESTLYVEVFSGGALVASVSSLIQIDPIDRWVGSLEPKTLAAFVLPDHPSLGPVLSGAKTALEELGETPSFDGYRDGDCKRVRAMAEAVFHALCKHEIAYTLAPLAFGRGQRVRLCKEVLGQKSGTCIDLACTYASLLESMNLNTLLFISGTHCWAGVWLVDKNADRAVCKSAQSFIEQVGRGNAIAVECTFFTKGNVKRFLGQMPAGHVATTEELSELFEQAVQKGAANFTEDSDFRYYVDIAYTRKFCNITPLPITLTERMTRSGERPTGGALGDTAVFEKTPRAATRNNAGPDVGKTPKKSTFTHTVPNYAASVNAPRPNKAIEYNLLDISTSVGQEQIDTIMEYDLPNIIEATVSSLDSDTACDFCLKTFSSSVQTVIPKTEVRELKGKELPHVECRGVTNMMAKACRSALEEVAAEKNKLKQDGIQPSGALVNLITDGNYTDEEGYAQLLPESLVNDIYLYNKYGQISTLAIGVGSDVNEDTLKQLGPDTEVKLEGESVLKDENGRPVTMKHAIRCKDDQGRKACWQAVVELLAIRSSNLSKNLVFVYEDDAYQEWMDQVDIVALDRAQYEIL